MIMYKWKTFLQDLVYKLKSCLWNGPQADHKIISCIVYLINCAWCSCFVTLVCHRGWWAFLSFHASACASSHLSLSHHVVALFILKDVCLSIQNDNTALTLLTFQLLAWKVMGWCTVSWSRLLFKMAMLGQFLHVPRNFETSMIAWDQVWAIVTHIRKCEQITSWPEIWWHDAMYHVLLCQCSLFFLGQPWVLSFSEHLVAHGMNDSRYILQDNFTWSWLPQCQWRNPEGSLQWRHNGHDGISNHQPHDCFLNRLFSRTSKKTSKLRVTDLCVGNSPVIGEFSAQMASNIENVSIWWHHHDMSIWTCIHQELIM